MSRQFSGLPEPRHLVKEGNLMPHRNTPHPAASRPARWPSRPPILGRSALRAAALAGWLRDRLRDDAGYTTETVIVTALLAAAALTVVAIIVAKVTGLANSINM
jgi:hypothetical protein